MSEAQLPPVPTAQASGAEISDGLANGEWHRMHPLTPLFKGGLALIVIAGIVIANMRDRLITWAVELFAPEEAHYGDYTGGDPVDWVLSNNLILVALLSVLGLVVVLILIFWFIWRFQQFRITGEHVEVRKGIIFRSHRRAPLDRVQGVNLTRPFPARIIGLAKLEVVGAGNDANVELEYLATPKAESVRADILRLASGARAARHAALNPGAEGADATAAAAPTSARAQLVGSVNAGVTGLITGVDLTDVVPESVVKIPTGRLVGSQLISGVLWFLFFAAIFAVAIGSAMIGMFADGNTGGSVVLLGLGLGMGVPMVIAVVGITWAQISKSLRYSIAPTPDGVRITYGLLTTVTETLPPGRIFAVEVSQSLLWRPFGWWTIKINRMSGKSAAAQSSGSGQQFNVVLPVGKRADVERVLGLVLPDVPAASISALWEDGIEGPVEGDAYRTMPRRARWRRPFSWKRHGYLVADFGLLLRRGVVWRKLAVFPLARLQGVSLSQGPIDRAQRVSGAQVHTVPGPITGYLSGLERADALALIDDVSRAAAEAASRDTSHRWSEHTPAASAASPVAPPPYAGPTAPVPPPYTGPVAGAPVPPPYVAPVTGAPVPRPYTGPSTSGSVPPPYAGPAPDAPVRPPSGAPATGAPVPPPYTGPVTGAPVPPPSTGPATSIPAPPPYTGPTSDAVAPEASSSSDEAPTVRPVSPPSAPPAPPAPTGE